MLQGGFFSFLSLTLQKCDIGSLVYNTSARFTKINGRSSLWPEGVRRRERAHVF